MANSMKQKLAAGARRDTTALREIPLG